MRIAPLTWPGKDTIMILSTEPSSSFSGWYTIFSHAVSRCPFLSIRVLCSISLEDFAVFLTSFKISIKPWLTATGMVSKAGLGSVWAGLKSPASGRFRGGQAVGELVGVCGGLLTAG